MTAIVLLRPGVVQGGPVRVQRGRGQDAQVEGEEGEAVEPGSAEEVQVERWYL